MHARFNMCTAVMRLTGAGAADDLGSEARVWRRGRMVVNAPER